MNDLVADSLALGKEEGKEEEREERGAIATSPFFVDFNRPSKKISPIPSFRVFRSVVARLMTVGERMVVGSQKGKDLLPDGDSLEPSATVSISAGTGIDPPPLSQNSVSYFDLLPFEMTVIILQFLDWKSLAVVRRVCRLWNEECSRESLWCGICKKTLGENVVEDPLIKLAKERKSWLWILRTKLIKFGEDQEKNGVGFVIHKNGDRYEGDWKKNKRDGLGLMKTGVDTYFGEFVSNMREGWGFCTSKNGSKYEGEWKKDLRDGKGKYMWSNGDVYEGEFKSHSRDGYGIYLWPSNDKYEGNFKSNAKHGIGCFYFANGDRFEGEYLQGKRNGLGTYTWPHGDVFVGEYKDDARNGHGRYQYAYGGIYCGFYVKDKRHGKGTFTWPDGDRYDGSWENESRRGPGALYTQDGKVIPMVWNEVDNANYAYFVPDKFPNASNTK